LIADLDTSGAPIALERLVMARRSTERHVVVSMTDLGAVAQRLAANSVSVSALGLPHGRPTIGGFARLLARLRATSPTIVQCWMYHAALAGLAAAPFIGRPRVLWSLRRSLTSFTEFSNTTAWTIRATARLSGLATAIVLNSEEGRHGFLVSDTTSRQFCRQWTSSA
jgi:hypothetical protein